MAVVRPNTDPKDLESAYKRGNCKILSKLHMFLLSIKFLAAYSDAMNADILRQLETFALEYDK